MSKHLGNLKRLHQKLAVALGEDHQHVVQLQEEISSRAVNTPQPLRCESAAVRPGMPRSFNHRWKYLNTPSA